MLHKGGERCERRVQPVFQAVESGAVRALRRVIVLVYVRAKIGNRLWV